MNIENLKIRNFLTIGEASLDLDRRGLLLIQGRNKDDSSAESNGSGKSSIVDALCWSLYGTTAREESGDAVVNITAKKNCAVTVTLRDNPSDDFTYEITRYRKDSVGKNQLVVNKVSPGEKSVDLSKGTDKETQEVVNQLVGCTLDVFMAAVYSGQEKMPDLPGMTDKMLKMLIEEAAGVEALTAAYDEARKRLNDAKLKKEGVASAVSTLTGQMTGLRSGLEIQLLNSKSFEDGRRERAQDELRKILPLNAAMKQLTEQLALTNEADLLDQLKANQATIDSYRTEEKKLSELVAAVATANNAEVRAKSAVQNAMSRMKAIGAKLADIDNHVGKPCGECGKAYHAEDLATARIAQQKNLDEAKAEVNALAEAWKKTQAVVEAAADAAANFKATMSDITAVATRQSEINAALNDIKKLKYDIDANNKAREAINQDAKRKLNEDNPWTKAIESKKDEIQHVNNKLVKASDELTSLVDEVELLTDAAKVFGPGGVRAHILDTVTPFLNDRTADYLGALSDGNIHAVWTTLSKTAKGDLKEKFNIEVSNSLGAGSFKGLSGGEKRKVRLATSMALQDMVASRAAKPIALYIADEVDHALDTSALERLMGVLEVKARERGTVLVISHNSLSDWIDNVITVTKEGGYSTVDGAVTR